MQRFMAQNGGRNYNAYFNNNEVPILTVYVAPINSSMVFKMKSYFEIFGNVESIRFHQRDDFEYAFVQFDTTEAANKALSKPQHSIENWRVKVKPAHFWHQPAPKPLNPLLIAPEQDSPAHILNALNEDCLREIFTHFNIKDLSIVADVCVRFQELAKCEFVKKHKTFIDLGHFDKFEMERLFSNFGSLIHSIRAECTTLQFGKEFFFSLNQHCTPQLKKLELLGFKITKKFIKKMRPNCSSLEYLGMFFCTSRDDMSNLISACQHVTKLVFDYCDFEKAKGLKQCLSNLKEACFTGGSLSKIALNEFIESNPTITKLTIKHYRLKSAGIFQIIGENLPSLVECEIEDKICNQRDFDNNIQFLSHLKSLKILKLEFNGLKIAKLLTCFIDNKIQIENFCATGGELSKGDIANISKMKQLKKLELHEFYGEIFTEEHLIQLAKELSQLEDLTLNDILHDVSTIGLKKMLVHANNLTVLKLDFYEISIDIDDYKAMLKSIQNRPNKKKLLIELTGEGEKLTVPEHILAVNRDIFFINEILEYKSVDSDYSNTTDSMFYDDSYDFDAFDDLDFFYGDDDDSEEGLVLNGQFFHMG